MGDRTGISWTDRTFNPWRGCEKVSAGCANCYMFTEQRRYGLDPTVVTKTGSDIWNKPKKWQKEAEAEGRKELVFTCSWSDWFIEHADAWRDDAWKIIKECPNLIFQILTKRPENICNRLPKDWGEGYENVALGVSVENNQFYGRVQELIKHPANIRFISAEPLLGSIADIPLEGIDWIITGGESGANFREMNLDWAREIRDRCDKENVAFFHKQGSNFKPGQDVLLDGKLHHNFPAKWNR